MSDADRAEPTNAELIETVLGRCDECGVLLNPAHATHSCGSERYERSAPAADRKRLRAADERPADTPVVIKATTANGGGPAYHARRAPSGPPEPACGTRYHVDAWRDTTLGQTPPRAHPCRHCWPRFSEVVE